MCNCVPFRKMAASSVKLENCEVCGANKAKYTCPKCEVRTCCLTCISIHKKELDCDGIRDRTKYMPLRKFSDLDVLSDYRLLEEIGRSVEQLQNDPSKKCTQQRNLPPHLHKLKMAAMKKGVKLELMPHNFSRHKENTTYLNWINNQFFWRVEMIFPQAENTKWVIDRVLDNSRLSVVLEQVLDPLGSLEDTKDIEVVNLRKQLADRLQYYRSVGLSGIKVLLKAEKIEKSNSRYYELDLTATLEENLRRKVIIEYPTLLVILRDHSDMYEIIETDDEEFQEDERIHKNRIRKPRRNESVPKYEIKKKTALSSFFFDAEFTDSEDEKEKPKKGSTLDIPEYSTLVKMEH